MDVVQNWLRFGGWEDNPSFQNNGIGKAGTAGFGLGLVCGFHAALVCVACSGLSANTLNPKFSAYMALLSTFHFLEFFVTAVKQPSTVTYDSFVINHSKSYTIAAGELTISFFILQVAFDSLQLQVGVSIGWRAFFSAASSTATYPRLSLALASCALWWDNA